MFRFDTDVFGLTAEDTVFFDELEWELSNKEAFDKDLTPFELGGLYI